MVLQENLAYINLVNSQNRTFTLGVTPFIHLTHSEFVESIGIQGLLQKKQLVNTRLRTQYFFTRSAPTYVDWREKGIFSDISNQGSCGSCYAMCTSEIIAAMNRLSGSSVPKLSAQQIVDCSDKYGNNGCLGGRIDSSLLYVTGNGLVAESTYPYSGKDQDCPSSLSGTRYTYRSYRSLIAVEEKDLQEMVAEGPIIVSLPSSWKPLQVGKLVSIECSITEVVFCPETARELMIMSF